MATFLEILKKSPDRSSAPKTLSFREKSVKIGTADSEIICLREIMKDKKRKKLTQAKYTALPACLPSRLNKTRNAWQSLAYSPLSAAVSPSSE